MKALPYTADLCQAGPVWHWQLAIARLAQLAFARLGQSGILGKIQFFYQKSTFTKILSFGSQFLIFFIYQYGKVSILVVPVILITIFGIGNQSDLN